MRMPDGTQCVRLPADAQLGLVIGRVCRLDRHPLAEGVVYGEPHSAEPALAEASNQLESTVEPPSRCDEGGRQPWCWGR